MNLKNFVPGCITAMMLSLRRTLVLYNFIQQKIQHPATKLCGVRFVYYSAISSHPKQVIVLLCLLFNFYFLHAQQTRLIMRADDMGITHATNLACRDVFTKGIATSVEIIAPSPWFLEAVKMLNENPGYDVGIHLAITSEWSNLKWGPVSHAPSLTDSNGYFYPTIWKGAPDFPSLNDNKPNFAEAEKELRAQIELVKKHLPQLSHISTHMGFDASHAELKKIVEKLSAEYKLPVTKEPAVLDFPGNENMRSDDKTKREAAFIEQLSKLEKGKTYLFVGHPCYNTQEMETVVSGSYTNVAKDRDADAALFMSEKVKAALQQHNIELISVKKFFEVK